MTDELKLTREILDADDLEDDVNEALQLPTCDHLSDLVYSAAYFCNDLGLDALRDKALDRAYEINVIVEEQEFVTEANKQKLTEILIDLGFTIE